MKNSSAVFLLEAIGEISESYVAEAQAPSEIRNQRISLRAYRRPAVIAASFILIAVIALSVTLGMRGRQENTPDPSSTPDEQMTHTVTVDDAVNAALTTLSETGIKATLFQAKLISDIDHPYYLVRLAVRDGVYDCSVDAQSGAVTEITYNDAPAATKATDPASSQMDHSPPPAATGAVSPAEGHDDSDAASSENTEKPSSVHVSPAVPNSSEAPSEYPTPYTPDGRKKPVAVVPYDELRPTQSPTEAYSDPIMDKLTEDAIRKNEEYIEKWNRTHPGSSDSTAINLLQPRGLPYVDDQGHVVRDYP